MKIGGLWKPMNNYVLLYYPITHYLRGGIHDYHRIPYSLVSLIAPLEAEGFSLRLLDARVASTPIDVSIKQEKPLFVGISSLTGFQLQDAMRTSKIIREIDPTIPIVWGGWHASLLPEATVRENFIDIVCVGQGEETIVEVAKALRDGSSLKEVKGVYFKDKKGAITITGPRPLLTIPPKLNLKNIPIDLYGPYIGYLTSYGCPWVCTFCAIAEVYHRKWWFREIPDVVEDIKYLIDNKKSPTIQVDIDDDNFFIDKNRVINFCNQWDNYKNIPIHVLAHVRLLKNYPDSIWKLMRNSGIRNILIGAESGNQTVLDRLKKHQTPENIIWFVKKCTEFDIIPQLSFLTGFPDSEELEDFKDTILLLAEAGRINPRLMWKLFYIRPYPGTELYYDFQRRGWPMPKTMKQWSEYTLRNTPIWVSKEFQDMVNFYLNFFVSTWGWEYTWDTFLSAFNAARSRDIIPGSRGI